MIRIYLSGPLFSRAEIEWGRRVKAFLDERLEGIENGIEILWPHEIPAGSAEKIFQANLQAMNQCDLMVAILDGPQVDDGTAWEIGYFFSSGRRVLGLRTDLRRAGEFDVSRVNLMVECSCIQIASNLEELAADLKGLFC
jgi:nucleoside 2-deoxyribosyltransferase